MRSSQILPSGHPALAGRGSTRRSPSYLYIVQCADGTYYTGATNNLEQRVQLHNEGRGAKCVRGKRPVRLVYAKGYRSYPQALRAERKLKALTRKQKEALVSLSRRCPL